jgi:ABC-type multidrug transport system fused ATPase/permease subunit
MTGLVAQQAMLFDDTVMNNIRYGSLDASDDEVIAAAEKAFAHKFIVERLDKAIRQSSANAAAGSQAASANAFSWREQSCATPSF